MDKYAEKKLGAPVKEIVKNELAVFTVDKFRQQMNAHLDDLLKDTDIAKAIDLTTMDLATEEVDERHNSAEAANQKEQEMQANITSLLGFCKAMEADDAALCEEAANIHEIIRTQFDDF